jgi:hypothetical protein
MPEAMDMILAILGYVMQETKALALQQNQRDKWILKIHIMTQHIVT